MRIHDPADLTGEHSIQNTLHYHTEGQGVSSPQSITTDIIQAYQVNASWLPDPYDHITVKLYNMADAKPREPLWTGSNSISSNGASGPHEVACCLSYYAQRNIKRHRGRIYCGPFTAAITAGPRPPATLRNSIMQLGQALFDVGGIDAYMVLHSPTDNDFKRISNFWVDDAWDTVRSRGIKPTVRVTAAGSTP